MEKNIDTIQKKADQIYNKFKSYFAYQVTTTRAHSILQQIHIIKPSYIGR